MVANKPSQNKYNPEKLRDEQYKSVMNAIVIGLVFTFRELFRVTLHYGPSPRPSPDRSPMANINSQSRKPRPRHHSNPKLPWQPNKNDTEHRGVTVSNQGEGFQTGKKKENCL